MSLSALATGRLVHGPLPEQFAAALAHTLGLRYGVPVNRGRTAVELALRSMGIGPGDDVVLPAYVCATLVEGVTAAGANPIFTDVGSDLNVTTAAISSALTASTRCVIVPHLFGRAAPIDEIEALLEGTGIALLDDAAQSFGARRAGRLVGSFGAAGIVAIGAGKSLAGPAGGVLVTNNQELYERARALARALPVESARDVRSRLTQTWLWRRWRRLTYPLYVVWERVMPSSEPKHVAAQMANVDGGIGLAQLRRLDAHSAERRANATHLDDALGELAQWSVTDLSSDGVQVKYVLVVPEHGPSSSDIMQAFALAGIETQGGYRPCKTTTSPASPLPETERLWCRVVCLPTETRLHTASLRAIAAWSAPQTMATALR